MYVILLQNNNRHELFSYNYNIIIIHNYYVSIRISLVSEASSAIKTIRSFLTASNESPEGYLIRQRVNKSVATLDLFDLNYALYRCEAEEHDDGQGGGVYEVPGAGKLVYCGLQGIMSMMAWVRDNNDLGHPLCCNLRDGDWMAGYTANRLKLRQGTKPVSECSLDTYIYIHVCKTTGM